MRDWIRTETRYFGQPVGYGESDSFRGSVWFVATLDAEGHRDVFLGQVEHAAGVYFALEYPTSEAAAEGAQDVEIGDALTLEEALAFYAAGE